MESNRGGRGARSLSLPPPLDRNDGPHFLPHLRYRGRSLRSRTLTPGLSPALNRTPVGSCAWRVPPRRGCIEYGPAINAEGIGAFQTKFGPDAFVVIEKWESPGALRVHATSPQMAAYAAKTRDMIADRTVYVLQPG